MWQGLNNQNSLALPGARPSTAPQGEWLQIRNALDDVRPRAELPGRNAYSHYLT